MENSFLKLISAHFEISWTIKTPHYCSACRIQSHLYFALHWFSKIFFLSANPQVLFWVPAMCLSLFWVLKIISRGYQTWHILCIQWYLELIKSGTIPALKDLTAFPFKWVIDFSSQKPCLLLCILNALRSHNRYIINAFLTIEKKVFDLAVRLQSDPTEGQIFLLMSNK